MSLHVFGIRHHGPGSARSLVAALEGLRPDAVLVEGPPDADDVLSLARHDEMKPPVALLVYPPDQPQRAVFYPFAEFSPEWQAIRYALAHKVPVRFIDLPQAIRLARPVPDETADEPEAQQPEEHDPIGLLAQAAGYSDHELWWEHQVERRQDAAGMFDAIREAMQSLRAEATPPPEDEALREAHMRTAIRAALKQGRERVAVVCGAWHAPALAEPGPAQPDAELLRGLPKVKTEATWIPWTHSRLSYRSGYGAGVQSPGWYHHLWTAPDRAAVRWGAQAARLLRAEDLEAPSASVIEVVRLADTLAALRDVPAGVATVYLSGLMGGLEKSPLPAGWREHTLMTYPFDLPGRRGVRLDYPLGWFSFRHIPVVAEQVQTDTYLACSLLADVLNRMADNFARPYLIEQLQALLEHRIITGYYPHLTLASNQRFASKGGYVVHFRDPGGTALVAEADWIVP